MVTIDTLQAAIIMLGKIGANRSALRQLSCVKPASATKYARISKYVHINRIVASSRSDNNLNYIKIFFMGLISTQ